MTRSPGPAWSLAIVPLLGVATTYVAARSLGPWAPALLAGAWLAASGRLWSRRSDRLGRSVDYYARLAERDDLTGLGNDRRFRSRIHELGEGSEPAPNPRFLILIDIDKFKFFNDTFGHPAGDRALAAVGGLLADRATGDIEAFRLGGDEFAALLPPTEPADARAFAEGLRAAIESHGWPLRAVTASLGVSAIGPVEPDGPAAIRDRADRALYRAKREGRNRVVAFDDC